MRRTRRFCLKCLFLILGLICMLHILLTVELNLPKKNDEILEVDGGVLLGNVTLFKNVVHSRVTRNISLPPPLRDFQTFYNRHNSIDLDAVVYGKMKPHPAYLTIGIPTVKRRYTGDNYLYTTLNSLISNIGQERVKDVVIVVFMADPDDEWNNYSAEKIYSEFKNHLTEGLIHILKAPKYIYPDFSKLVGTKQDSAERVRWRSKQNVDFAFLMLYCQKLSKYYIQLEDDVLVAPDFLTDIEQFESNITSRWICLEFSTLGFIGKMFHSSDLKVISTILLTYFSETPCDLLLGGIIKFLGQTSPIHSTVSLFQHIGKISSLRNKMMPSIDRLFKGIGSKVLPIMQLPKGDHPTAKFKTNMKVIPGHPPENVYKDDVYFWASYPKSRQYFQIIFEKPLNISRLIISTGENVNKTDFLERGIVKGGKVDENNMCNNFTDIGPFIEGEFDSMIQGIALRKNIGCLHIEVKKGQKHWLIIRDVEIFLDKAYKT